MRSTESIKQSNEMRDKIIDILEQNQGMKAVYPLLHYFESQFREPSTQGGEEQLDGLLKSQLRELAERRKKDYDRLADSFERLKQENEKLKEELIRKNNSISKLRISVNQKKKF